MRRLHAVLAEWEPAPISAALFGSAARRDGDIRSDIDLLIVRPALRTEPQRREWAHQASQLRAQVHAWTGNRLQILDRTLAELARVVKAREPIIAELRADAGTVAGQDIVQLLEELA